MVAAAIAGVVLLIVVGVLIATIGNDGTIAASSPTGRVGETSSPAPTHPTSQPAKPTVATNALSGLLLPPNAVDAAMGVPASGVVQPGGINKQIQTSPGYDRCQSSTLVNPADLYRGSGYISVRGQRVVGRSTPDAQPFDWLLIDGVAAFPNAADATNLVESAKRSWQDCANQTIKRHEPTEGGGYDINWTLGSFTTADDVLFMPMTQEGGEGWVCWHALGARNNIVIDVMACTAEATKAAAQGAYNAIAAKVDAAA